MKKRTPKRRETSKDYKKFLGRVVDVIFDYSAEVKDWSWYELAKESGLSYSTVYRLGTYQTRFPELHTVWKLCKAVGLSFSIHEEKLTFNFRQVPKAA